jgi:hypothetical protein
MPRQTIGYMKNKFVFALTPRVSAYRRSERLPKETPLAIRILISTVVPLRRTFTIAKRDRAPAKPPAYYLWRSNHKVNG